GEELRGVSELVEAVSDDLLRGAIHGRGVDQTPARGEEGPHDLGAGIAPGRVVADVEGNPAPEPDQRQAFAARRDGPSQDRRAGGRRRKRSQAGDRSRGDQGAEEGAAVECAVLSHSESRLVRRYVEKESKFIGGRQAGGPASCFPLPAS